MEGEVGIDEGEPIAGSGRDAHRLEGSFQLPAIAGIATGYDQPGGGALEGGSDLVDLLDLPGVEDGDEGAAARLLMDKPFGSKHGQCLADGPPARLELSRDVGFDEAKPRRERAGQDALPEELCRRLGKRGAGENR